MKLTAKEKKVLQAIIDELMDTEANDFEGEVVSPLWEKHKSRLGDFVEDAKEDIAEYEIMTDDDFIAASEDMLGMVRDFLESFMQDQD